MKTVHVILHQHFDVVWRREVAWYVKKRNELYQQALELLKRKEATTFSFCQALPFREFLNNNPEHRESVANMLSCGRLEIIGGLETICDLNMTSGAAIIRNIQMGKEYFKKEFDYDIKIGAFEDAFGVCQQLPQILKLSGYSIYKASRMTIHDKDGLCGNFKWQGSDGTVIRCISTEQSNFSWGWGYPDNPDDPLPTTYDAKYKKIYDSLLGASKTDAEQVLFVVMGEEHNIFKDIDLLVNNLNHNTQCNYEFSTFSRYYDSLANDYWKQVPLVTKDTDLSRIFTGCYTSRIESKRNPRLAEHRLIAAETNAVLGKQNKDFSDSWRKLFIMQFHDAICGCHIRENAEYLDTLCAEVLDDTLSPVAKVLWEPTLPDFEQQVYECDLPKTITKTWGEFSIEIKNNLLHNIKYADTSFGSVCSVSLREDNGTLWTEEYSNAKYTCTEKEKVISVQKSAEILKLSTYASAPSFLKMWPGFSQLVWVKHYSFHKKTGMVKIVLELNWLGNSTEIALRWESPVIDTCVAETPFASMSRTPITPSGDTIQGDAFPVLNWVKTANFAIFNTGTPAHAIREGKLETVVLRSPVKRWSPWFPVTPDYSSWDNGSKKFTFLWMPTGEKTNNSDLHRMGVEFNFKLPLKKADSSVFLELPHNLVVCGLSRKDNNIEALIFEADGIECSWDEYHFSPYEIKRVLINQLCYR